MPTRAQLKEAVAKAIHGVAGGPDANTASCGNCEKAAEVAIVAYEQATRTGEDPVLAVAKAINAAAYGKDAERRWAQSDMGRGSRKKEAIAAIAAIVSMKARTQLTETRNREH